MTGRRVGVEEEFLLVDPVTGDLRPVSHEVRRRHINLHPDRFGLPQIKQELFLEQIEVANVPCVTLSELAGQLRLGRTLAAEAAEQAGAAIAALGTAGTRTEPTLSHHERYGHMAEHHRLLATENLVCATQVHVEVANDDEAVAALDRIRPWLPVLLAVSANSPFWHGADTGYASYRAQVVGRWPSAAQTERFGDAATYHAAVRDLLRTTAALDEAMIYFDARLSTRYPTLEVRIADACTEVSDTVLVAALVRGLVETGVREERNDASDPPWRAELLRASTWLACRFGLTQQLVHPLQRRPSPAFEVLEALVQHITPALDDAGDTNTVHALVEELQTRGTGSVHQRQAFARRNRFEDVVIDAVERTRATYR